MYPLLRKTSIAGLDPQLSQSGLEEFYGIRLNELAEQLKERARLGV